MASLGIGANSPPSTTTFAVHRSGDAMPRTVLLHVPASCPAGITPPLQRPSHARDERRVAHLGRRLAYLCPNDLERALRLGLACRNGA
jgi:hypothetical protein